MPLLSVAMIVKNEAHCLAACLDSVHDIADEILIGDTGSTDDTVAVAREHGAKILSIPWQDDFSAVRNAVLAEATGDWLLHVDADEVVDPDGAGRIREIVDNDGQGADAIEVILANYSDDMRAWRWVPVSPLKGGRGDLPSHSMSRGYAGYIAVGLLRLFRNHRGFEYREAVHENITESVAEHCGVVRREPIVIHHYGFAGDPAKAQAKASFYRRIAQAKVKQRPNDPKAWYDLAEQSLACGDAATAETASRKALSIAANDLSSASILANILLNRGDLDEAHELFERLEQSGISTHHVGTVLGAIACKQGRLEEARQRLEDTINRCPSAVQAYLYLARTLDRLGDIPAAHTQLEKAQEIAPRIQEIADRLQAHDLRQAGERQFKYGNPQDALRTLVQALRLDPEDPLTHNDIGTVLMTLGLHDKAQESFHRARLLLAPTIPESASE
jgi:Tfp pilus assembly protein PilF